MRDHPTPCARIQHRATLYLDGRLPAAERRRIQDHLRACTRCIAEYKALRRLSRLAADLPRVRPPRTLARRVRRSLAQRRQSALATLGQRRPRARRIAAVIALLLAVAALGMAVGWTLGYRAGAAPLRPRGTSEEPRAPTPVPEETREPRLRMQMVDPPESEPAVPASLPRR